MNVSDAKKQIKQLEKDLNQAIANFENLTECKVTRISLDRRCATIDQPFGEPSCDVEVQL